MTDERHDDEVLGRALSRAIETIDVNQTPFEKSRIATQPAKRGFPLWQVATGAAAIILALALGSWLTRPTDGQPGVAASPTASVGTTPSTSGTPAPTPAPTATPVPVEVDHQRIYFARDGQPPVSAQIDSTGVPPAPEPRIQLRLSHLLITTQLPPGSFSAFSSRTTVGVNSVRVSGDTATVDFRVNGGDWGIRGGAQSLAAVQQLVYTATEEPGIRRVLMTQNGGGPVTIDQILVDKPLAREDVFGYTAAAGDQIVSDGTREGPAAALRLSSAYSVDTFALGLTRFVVTVQSSSGALPDGYTPRFTAYLERVGAEGSSPNEIGKWRLNLLAEGTDAKYGTEVVDRTPVRAVQTTAPGANQTTYGLALDDARPWRVFILSNPTRIVVDIGGDPRATSDRIAVTAPKPGDIANSGADLALSGSARVFEANVVWRLLDSAGNAVANGHFLTSLGSSAVWGTFNTRIAMPANVRGNLTLELFEASAKDGTPQGVVQIPLVVR